jgi:hypothetical protein
MANDFNEKETVIKISYLGPQDKPIASLLFQSSDTDEAISIFRELNVLYDNDEFGIQRQQVSEMQMNMLINASKSYANKKNQILAKPQIAVVVLNLKTRGLLAYQLEKKPAVSLIKEFRQILPSNNDLSVWIHRSRLSE